MERFFLGSRRLFSSKGALVTGLGCTLEYVDHMGPGKNVLGRPPSPDDARLLSSRRVEYRTWTYALHEAVHAFCGERTFDDEVGMMALEVSFYAMLTAKSDREDMFAFFASSLAEDEAWELGEVGVLISKWGSFEPVWRGLVRDADASWFTEEGELRADVFEALAH